LERYEEVAKMAVFGEISAIGSGKKEIRKNKRGVGPKKNPPPQPPPKHPPPKKKTKTPKKVKNIRNTRVEIPMERHHHDVPARGWGEGPQFTRKN